MSENREALWSFDDKVSNILADLKSNFLSSMFNWDLENAYFVVRILWMEADAKLDRKKKEYPEDAPEKEQKTEADYAAELADRLEQSRTKYLNNQLDKGLYFKELETFYMIICLFMKYNGLYFREGFDPSKAALRR